MEEIKVGEYVRINGRIYKVLDMDNVFLYVDKEVRYSEEYNASIHYINKDEYEIVKHSFNIIDLIEVGDYVNGMEVLDIYTPRDLWEPIEIRVDSRYTNYLTSDDIKTILTKEQYKSNCYEVK